MWGLFTVSSTLVMLRACYVQPCTCSPAPASPSLPCSLLLKLSLHPALCPQLISVLQPEPLVSVTRQRGGDLEQLLSKSSQYKGKGMVKIISTIPTCCTGEEPRGACSFGSALRASQVAA